MGQETDTYFKCTNVIHVLSLTEDCFDITLAKSFGIMEGQGFGRAT